MQAINLEPEYLRRLDNKYPDIIARIEREQPQFTKEGDVFCCSSGQDLNTGVFGFGPTMPEALEDWEKAFGVRDCR